MRLRSDDFLVGTARGGNNTRTLRRRVEEEQWTMNSPSPSKENLDNLFWDQQRPRSCSNFGQSRSALEEDQADARLGQPAN